MLNISDDLNWLLLRNNNSCYVKRHGNRAFSTESGNLLNLHSFKYSGLANKKVVHVEAPYSSGIILTRRKTYVSPHAMAEASESSIVRPGSGRRRALGAVAATFRAGYRPDLLPAALARTSAVTAAQRRTEKPKALRQKKIRGKKRKAVKSAQV